MSVGLSLTDPLWAELYEGRVDLPEMQLSEQEWTWLTQVAEIPSEGRDSSNFSSPAVSFRLRSEEYWISLRRGPDFPEAPPMVKCSFRPGFFFDWGQNSSLSSVISQFREYCQQLDETIALLKSVGDYGRFSLQGFVLDEEDPDFMEITIKFEDIDDSEEEISLRIDWRSPNEFPSELTSSNSDRFRNLDCDQWNAEDLLGMNLAKLCGVPVDDLMPYFCQMSSTPACVIAQAKDVSASSKELHSIPSKIEYTGPANIQGSFIREKGEDATLRAAFRGRGLEGCELRVPEGYEVYVLKERANSATTAETRRFDIVDRASSFTLWEWDREAGPNSQPSRAFSSLLVAKALADD